MKDEYRRADSCAECGLVAPNHTARCGSAGMADDMRMRHPGNGRIFNGNTSAIQQIIPGRIEPRAKNQANHW